jgi:hypothetical protein
LLPGGLGSATAEPRGCIEARSPDETSAKSQAVILRVAQDLVFTNSYEILRSPHSLRMTDAGTFAEVSR